MGTRDTWLQVKINLRCAWQSMRGGEYDITLFQLCTPLPSAWHNVLLRITFQGSMQMSKRLVWLTAVLSNNTCWIIKSGILIDGICSTIYLPKYLRRCTKFGSIRLIRTCPGQNNHGDLLRMIHASSEYQESWFERGESTSASGRTRHVLGTWCIRAKVWFNPSRLCWCLRRLKVGSS
jgi:hypothetical protein